MIETETTDKSAQLAVKDAILARSGIYLYSQSDVQAMGMKPKINKPVYREYRPAGVLIDSKDKFSLVPVPKNHPPVDITAENFHEFASGVTGGPIEAVTLPNGEVGLKGKIAFFTTDAYDFYMSGSKETSAGYAKTLVYSDDPDRDGYDWMLTGITSVNHVAVLPRGRGGNEVRVLDKAANINNSNDGGTKMAIKAIGGFLASLGIGKPKDEKFDFSQKLMESVAKVHTLDAAGLDNEVASVMTHVSGFGDSTAKEVLVGAVADCFKHPVEVLAKKEEVSKKINELYVKCQDADAAVISGILDAEKPEEKEEKEKKDPEEKPEAEAKDLVAAIDAAMEKAVATITSGLDAKIDSSVKKALGLDEPEKKTPAVQLGVTGLDGANIENEDASYLMRGIFGNR